MDSVLNCYDCLNDIQSFRLHAMEGNGPFSWIDSMTTLHLLSTVGPRQESRIARGITACCEVFSQCFNPYFVFRMLESQV